MGQHQIMQGLQAQLTPMALTNGNGAAPRGGKTCFRGNFQKQPSAALGGNPALVILAIKQLLLPWLSVPLTERLFAVPKMMAGPAPSR